MDNFIIILTIVVPIISIILFCIALKIVLVDLPDYEKQINKLYKEKEEKIEKERRSTKLTAHIEGAIKNIKEEYNPKIEELERKRRFLSDKIPFLKK